MNEEKEIIIQRVWLETLLKYAERTRKESEKNAKIHLQYHLPELLGYISSAEHILDLPLTNLKEI